jgi:hypothetical protein
VDYAGKFGVVKSTIWVELEDKTGGIMAEEKRY